MQIEIEKLSIDFKCPNCKDVETRVDLGEVIEYGAPMCNPCNEVMEYVCAHLEQMEGVSG